jgi:hypothetical protein
VRSEPPKDYDPERGASQARKNIEDLRERIPLLKGAPSDA